MTILTILLVLLLAGGIYASRAEMKSARVLLVLASLAAVAVVVTAYLRSPARLEALALADDESAAGAVLGRLVAKEAAGGTVLVLRHPPLKLFRHDITAARFEGLQRGLKEAGVRVIQGGPNRENMGSDDPSVILFASETLGQQVRAWCATNREVKLVVSLLATTPDLRGKDMPSVYGFVDVRDVGWTEAVRDGSMKAAILYRVGPAAAGSTTGAEGLPAKFVLATAQNFEAARREANPF